jgi:hypothetical protein
MSFRGEEGGWVHNRDYLRITIPKCRAGISCRPIILNSFVDRFSNGMKTTRRLVCAVLRAPAFWVRALRTRWHGQKAAWLRFSSFRGMPCCVVAPCQPTFWPHTRARPTEESRIIRYHVDCLTQPPDSPHEHHPRTAASRTGFARFHRLQPQPLARGRYAGSETQCPRL